MAQKFSKPFYNSKRWKKVRQQVFNRDFGLCVDCGKAGEEVHHLITLTPENIHDINITLNEDRLVTLCKDCHFKRHETDRYDGCNELSDEFEFDIMGNIVRK